MLTNLAEVCREAGLRVVETPGWKTRGRPGAFAPVGVLCHHTATGPRTSDAAVLRLLIGGRSDLPGPLCQLGLGRDGTVYVIAAGRANHAGKAKASGTVAAGDGNTLYIGIEAFNDGRGEPFTDAQYDVYVRLCAALSAYITGGTAETVRGHKETSVTGKIDPVFLMAPFRRAVAALLTEHPPTPAKETTVSNNVTKARVDIAEAIAELDRAIGLLRAVPKKRVAARAQIGALTAARAALATVLKRLPAS